MNTMSESMNQLPDDFDLPAGLRADLKSLYGGGPAASAKVERAILAQVPPHMARINRLRIWLRYSGAAAAVAAALLIAIRLVPHPPAFHEGQRVTILDAFSLARQLKAGRTPDKSWDVNHDGKVDQADVDTLAQRAVAIGGAQ
jgi:hypothetical protein